MQFLSADIPLSSKLFKENKMHKIYKQFGKKIYSKKKKNSLINAVVN